jgi:hypothetical protein
MKHTALRSFLMVALICALGTAAEWRDRRDWQSLAQLQAGDKVRLSLKTGSVEGAFQNWTPEQVTAGTVTAKREDVLNIERYRQSGGGRGKHAAIGALIGFGGGFAIGAAVDPTCHTGQFVCIQVSRGVAGAVGGGVGALIGAGIGALLPTYRRPACRWTGTFEPSRHCLPLKMARVLLRNGAAADAE